MSDDRKSAFEHIKKLIEEGKIHLPGNTPLYNAMFSDRDKTRNPIVLLPKPIIGVDPAFEELPPQVLYFTEQGYAAIDKVTNLSATELDEAKRILWNSMDAKARADYLFGIRPEELPTSTVSSKSTQPALTLESLREAIAKLPKDPLLEKGIQKDWVCVIRPRIVANILDYVEKNPYPFMLSEQGKLNTFFGRFTYIINEAQTDIEYMTKEAMYDKYPEWALREIEAAKRLQEEEEGE